MFDAWLRANGPDRFELRDEGLLRLFFGELLDADDVARAVRRRRAWYELSAAGSGRSRNTSDGLGDTRVRYAVLDYGIELISGLERGVVRRARGEAQLRPRSSTPRGPRPESGGSGPPLSAAAISPQSGWCPTATTVPSRTLERLAQARRRWRPAPGGRRAPSCAPSALAIASAVSRARRSGLERTTAGEALAAEAFAQSPGLLAAVRRQLPQLVGLPGAALAWRTRKSRTKRRE